MRNIVIVGGGLAGARAAAELRARGFDGRVTLACAEDDPPYERPPLSKAYLRGDSPLTDAYVHAPEWYAEADVELLPGTAASRVDPHGRRVELADGRVLGYDRLLLATGAEPRRPPIEGAELEGVLTLRTRLDADGLRARLRDGAGPLAIVGGGWIGCEVAASAREMGCAVTVLEARRAPLEPVLGPRLGEHVAALHRDHGVDVRSEATVERFEGAGRLEAVRLADGTTIDAATAVLAVGVRPNARLAAEAGLQVSDGLEVDACLRTADPHILAAGDVALAHHPRYNRPVRVEHWATAARQGEAAARSMLGSDEPHAELPYFFSDQYDSGMEYVGLHRPGDDLVVRHGDGWALTALWISPHGEVSAGLQVDDWDATGSLRALVGSRPDPERVRDTDVSLADLTAHTVP